MDALREQIRFQEKQDHAIVSALAPRATRSAFTDGVNWTLGIAATWPLRNGGSDEALIAQHREQHTQLELSIADKLQQIDTVHLALEALDWRSSVEDAAQSVISAQTARTRILLAYENDVAPWIDLRDAESMPTAAEQGSSPPSSPHQLARAALLSAIATDTLDELLVPDIIEPPTVPEMPSLSTRSRRRPYRRCRASRASSSSPPLCRKPRPAPLPSEHEDGGSAQ